MEHFPPKRPRKVPLGTISRIPTKRKSTALATCLKPPRNQWYAVIGVESGSTRNVWDCVWTSLKDEDWHAIHASNQSNVFASPFVTFHYVLIDVVYIHIKGIVRLF